MLNISNLWVPIYIYFQNKLDKVWDRSSKILENLENKYAVQPIMQLWCEHLEGTFIYAVGHNGVTLIERCSELHTFRIVCNEEAVLIYEPTGYTIHYVPKPTSQSEEPQTTVIH